MANFICNTCGTEFKSKLDEPPCPQGCRYPFEKMFLNRNLITTQVVEGKPPAAKKKKVAETPQPENKSLLDKAKDVVGLGEKEEIRPTEEKPLDSGGIF